MSDFLANVLHPWWGYLTAAVLLITVVIAFKRAKDAVEFTKGPYTGALVLLDVQVLLGLILYGVAQGWEARPEIAYIHPILAVLALGVGHALVGRAKKTQMAPDAHRLAGRGLLLALILALLAVGIASAPAFL